MMKNDDVEGQRADVHTEPPIHIGPGRKSKPIAGAPGHVLDAGGVPTTAIIAWHGMGQQLPFETVEVVARGLAEREGRLPGRSEPRVAARIVELGDEKLWRAELVLTDDQGQLHPVHVYEAYWAPCTQGKITLAETMLFLIGAGYQGVRY